MSKKKAQKLPKLFPNKDIEMNTLRTALRDWRQAPMAGSFLHTAPQTYRSKKVRRAVEKVAKAHRQLYKLLNPKNKVNPLQREDSTTTSTGA